MRLIDADALEKDLFPEGTSGGYWGFGQLCEMLDRQPTLEAIPKGAYEQVKWERDMAVQQLNDYGVQLGEKADCVRVVRCRECKYSDQYTENHVYCNEYQTVKVIDGFCDFGKSRGD